MGREVVTITDRASGAVAQAVLDTDVPLLRLVDAEASWALSPRCDSAVPGNGAHRIKRADHLSAVPRTLDDIVREVYPMELVRFPNGGNLSAPAYEQQTYEYGTTERGRFAVGNRP